MSAPSSLRSLALRASASSDGSSRFDLFRFDGTFAFPLRLAFDARNSAPVRARVALALDGEGSKDEGRDLDAVFTVLTG